MGNRACAQGYRGVQGNAQEVSEPARGQPHALLTLAGRDAARTHLTQSGPHERYFLNARSYFVIIGRGGALGAGAAGESANVTHAFQPEGRSNPSNSAYALKLR